MTSDQALYKAVIDPKNLLDIPSEISQGVRKLGAILFTAQDLIKQKSRVEVVMWSIWNTEISEVNKKYLTFLIQNISGVKPYVQMHYEVA